MSEQAVELHEELQRQIHEAALALKQAHFESDAIYATAESLTAGLIAASMVEIAGSSAWFDRGFVTYNNKAKQEMLGVSDFTLESHSELSLQCVAQMAQGALQRSVARIAVAVSGVAGPDGGTAQNPVGTVYLGICRRGECPVGQICHFQGSRQQVRLQTTLAALKALYAASYGELSAPWQRVNAE